MLSKKPLLIFTVIAVNLILINWKIFVSPKVLQIPIVEKIIETPQTKSSSLSTPLCPSGCLQKIKEAAQSLQLLTEQASEEDQASVIYETGVQSYAQEFFVSIGSGSTTKNKWTTLSGLEAQVNSSNYSNIDKVSFEASLRIPTGVGRIGARLINLSDNVPLAETEVYLEGTEGKRIERIFNLRSGNKVYGVQMKSTIGALGILDMARIKIITN